MDQIPEFFDRAEKNSTIVQQAIDDKDFEAFHDGITKYAGDRWINSAAQERALRIEAERLGIPLRKKELAKKQLTMKERREKAQRLLAMREERGGQPFSRVYSFTRNGKRVSVRRDRKGRFTSRSRG